jgi:hypothetical protein
MGNTILFIYLFICVLVHDAVSISGHIASNEWVRIILVNKRFRSMWIDLIFWKNSGMFLEGQKKPTKRLRTVCEPAEMRK